MDEKLIKIYQNIYVFDRFRLFESILAGLKVIIKIRLNKICINNRNDYLSLYYSIISIILGQHQQFKSHTFDVFSKHAKSVVRERLQVINSQLGGIRRIRLLIHNIPLASVKLGIENNQRLNNPLINRGFSIITRNKLKLDRCASNTANNNSSRWFRQLWRHSRLDLQYLLYSITRLCFCPNSYQIFGRWFQIVKRESRLWWVDDYLREFRAIRKQWLKNRTKNNINSITHKVHHVYIWHIPGKKSHKTIYVRLVE